MALSTFLSRTLIVAALVISATPALSATWWQVRDKAMALKEAGRSTEAYALAVATTPERAAEIADRDFLTGYIALRSLGRADVAVEHFVAMARNSGSLRGVAGESMRSKAGYWLADALEAAKRPNEARQFRELASRYRDTFYGMLAATGTGAADTANRVASVRGRYPDMVMAWHDGRVARELVLAVIKQESEFRPKAVSGKGAQGLMQVMPDTARHVGRSAGVAIDVAMMGRDGNYNVAVGSKHLADLYVRYDGSIPLATAAYNAGQGRVDEWIRRFGDPRRGVSSIDWIENIPYRETREYVQRVFSNYLSYLALRGT